MLTCSADDPSQAGARNLDWEQFLETHDYRYGVIASDLASGKTMVDAAKECGLGYGHLRVVKERMAEELLEFMGDDAIADALRAPGWKGNILVDKEKMACRRIGGGGKGMLTRPGWLLWHPRQASKLRYRTFPRKRRVRWRAGRGTWVPSGSFFTYQSGAGIGPAGIGNKLAYLWRRKNITKNRPRRPWARSQLENPGYSGSGLRLFHQSLMKSPDSFFSSRASCRCSLGPMPPTPRWPALRPARVRAAQCFRRDAAGRLLPANPDHDPKQRESAAPRLEVHPRFHHAPAGHPREGPRRGQDDPGARL